jgi:creatinine amidohydrolase
MLASRYFVDLTQPEIAGQLKKNPLVILPQGSVEQHGPHLPTGTDIFASNDVVKETCASVAQHGAKYLLILNWHELNIPPLGVAADLLHREHGMTVLTVQACFVAEDMFGKECGGLTHGGEIEALAVLAYRPDLVHLERIDYSSDHAHGHKVDALRRTRSYQPVLTDVRSIAPTGWYGSPQHATIEKAQKMLNRVADSIATESAEIFKQLDKIQGGTAELRQLSKVR